MNILSIQLLLINRAKTWRNLENFFIKIKKQKNANYCLLKWKNKIVFVDKPFVYNSCFFVKGYRLYKIFLKLFRKGKVPNLFHTKNFFNGKRFIDEFDYVSYINTISKVSGLSLDEINKL